jgi:hypothetical protein
VGQTSNEWSPHVRINVDPDQLFINWLLTGGILVQPAKLERMTGALTDLLRTAEDYRHYAQKKSNAHYRMAEKANASGKKFGIPVTVATSIVGTSIFATLSSSQHNLVLQISTGLLSLGAAVLSALHTFFNFSEVATQHKAAAAAYESVRHELDAFILDRVVVLRDQDDMLPAVQQLRKISQHLDDIAKTAPTISDQVYDTSQTRVATRPIVGIGERADKEL